MSSSFGLSSGCAMLDYSFQLLWKQLANYFHQWIWSQLKQYWKKMEVCSSRKSYLGSYQWYALALTSEFVLINYLFTRIRISKLYPPELFTLLKRRELSVHATFYHGMHCMTCLSVVTISACQVVRFMGFTLPLTLDYMLFSCAAWGCNIFPYKFYPGLASTPSPPRECCRFSLVSYWYLSYSPAPMHYHFVASYSATQASVLKTLIPSVKLFIPLS